MKDKVKIVWKKANFTINDGGLLVLRRVAWLRLDGIEYPLCEATRYSRKSYWYLRWYRDEYEEVDTIGRDLGWKFDYLRGVKKAVKHAVLVNLWKVLQTAKEDGCGRPY